MKTQSSAKLPLVLNELRTCLLNFNEQQRTITPETGEPYTMWEYDSFRVQKPMDFRSIVVAMIRDRYSENDEAKFARWNLEASILKTKTMTEEEITELSEYSNYVAWCIDNAQLAKTTATD